MHSGAARSLFVLVMSGTFIASAWAQTMQGKPAALKRIEPGLEEAVKWEWRVALSDGKDWGPPSPDPTPTPTPTPPPSVTLPQPESRPTLYDVKRGDALILIGKKFGMTVSQIKTFNG